MNNAVIYCRVSTEDQEREGTSLQTQLESCFDYCTERGYNVVQSFSEAYSGLTLNRPKLYDLLDYLKTENIHFLVIYCLDRLTRNPNHGVILFEELKRLNVVLESVTEEIENTDLGRLMNYVQTFASKLEADKIRERTTRGKIAHAKNGKLPIGTGIGIYGYTMDKTSGKRFIIDHEAEVVRNIFTWAMVGYSVNRIATQLNEQGIPTKSGSK